MRFICIKKKFFFQTRAAVKLEYEDKRETIMTIFRGLELRRNAAANLSITSVDNTLSYIDKKTKKVQHFHQKWVFYQFSDFFVK